MNRGDSPESVGSSVHTQAHFCGFLQENNDIYTITSMLKMVFFTNSRLGSPGEFDLIHYFQLKKTQNHETW